MADNSKHYETLGQLWDTMSTGQKIGFTVFATTILFAVGGIGFWFGRVSVDSRVTKIEAEKTLLQLTHSREVARLEGDVRRERTKPAFDYEIRLLSPTENLPKLDDAPFDPRSITAFGKDYQQKQQSNEGKTKINQTALGESGKRFEWSGFVEDVDDMRARTVGLLINSEEVHTFKPDFSVISGEKSEGPPKYRAWCYFDAEKYAHRLREFKIDDPIHLTGVMDENGSLHKCELR